MHKNFFFVCFVFVFALNTFSQAKDSLLRVYNNETIYRYGNVFRKGNERLSFSDLKQEFSFSDLGVADYQMAKKYRTLTLITNLAATGCFYAMGLSFINGKSKTGYILLGGSILLGVGVSRFRILSAKHLDRALWQRNKDLLFR